VSVQDLAPAEIAERARAGGRLAIDTEFMSESRYRALLCLVQVAVPEPDEGEEAVSTHVLDPLEGFDHAPLAEVLADPSVEVVMHAGRQDVPILRREWETEVRGVFDTQVAAAFAGVGAQVGYGGLLADVLGIRVEKGASFTRWDRRPLSSEQVEYARDDVRHLLALSAELQRRLHEGGRLEWAREECRALESATDQRDPAEAWRRLSRVARLKPAARAMARELAAWREETAQEENRPVGSVLNDAPLVEIATRSPRKREALEQIRGVHGGTLSRYGKQILAAVERGQAASPIPVDEERGPRAVGADGPVIAVAEALVRQRVSEAKMAYELVASRADITAIVVAARSGQAEANVRTLQGWRRDLVGEELLELLAGRRSLAVAPTGRLEVSERSVGDRSPDSDS